MYVHTPRRSAGLSSAGLFYEAELKPFTHTAKRLQAIFQQLAKQSLRASASDAGVVHAVQSSTYMLICFVEQTAQEYSRALAPLDGRVKPKTPTF